MKKNLILIICFLVITLPSIESSNVTLLQLNVPQDGQIAGISWDKTPSYPSTVQMQKRKSNNMITPSGMRQNENIQKMFHSRGSIDINYLKNLYHQCRFKNHSRYRRPFEVIKHLQMPAIRNDGSNQQIPNFYTRYNRLKNQYTRNPFRNDRIIFLPPYAKSNNKQPNFFQSASEYKLNETSHSNPHENMSNQKPKTVTNEVLQKILIKDNFKQTEENIKYVKTFPWNGGNIEIEKQYTTEYSTVFDVAEVSKAIEDSDFRTSEIPEKSISTTEIFSRFSPHYFLHRKKPQPQLYEVEEIIEEGLSIDLGDEKINVPFEESTIVAQEINKVKNSGNGQKVNGVHDMMSSSISSVIETLMSPMMKIFPVVDSNREIFPKEKIQNRPVFNNYFSPPSPHHKTFSGQNPKNFHKIISNDRLSSNRYEQSKHLKVKTPVNNEKFQNLTQQTEESTADSKKIELELNNRSKVDMIYPSNIEYNKNNDATSTTEIMYEHSSTSKTAKNNLNLKKNSQQTTTAMTETEYISESRDKILPTLFENQETLRSFTTQTTLNTESENPSTVSSKTQTTHNTVLPSEDFTTEKFFQFDESTENFTEAKTPSEVKYIKTEESFTETAINTTNTTNPDFQGFTDHLTTSDSIKTTKSDFNKKSQDAIGKNGRKMNFDYELDKTTTSNLITESGNTVPRRSDILITESFYDYVEDDNNLSPLNYVNKLKQNNSFLHPTFESIMPYIPVVIDDLREGRLSPEDILILSKAFGKYWSSVMVLLNVTNLDMLPLLKMKNEEDWNNIWQSFIPETTQSTEPTTIQTTETSTKQEGDYYSSYDYLSEYEGFYEYVFKSEKEEKEKKRKKARFKREGKGQLKKFREYFESTDDEENSVTSNIYEEMLYIQTSEDTDIPI